MFLFVLVALGFDTSAWGIELVRSGNEENDENEPRPKSWFVFVTYHLGLPLPGSPLVFSALQMLHRAMMSRPHPLERGGADATGLAFPGEFRRLDLSPHPSREGRGSFPGCCVCLRARWVARAKVVVVGWVEDERNSTVMGLIFN